MNQNTALSFIDQFEIVGDNNDSRDPTDDEKFILREFILQLFDDEAEQPEAAASNMVEWKAQFPSRPGGINERGEKMASPDMKPGPLIAQLLASAKTEQTLIERLWADYINPDAQEAATLITRLISQSAEQEVLIGEHIAAQREAEARAAWQPIETAPKDDTPVLLIATRHSMLMPHPEMIIGAYRRGWWSGPSTLSHVTHWMPLPKAPAALSAATEGGDSEQA